MKTYHPIQWVEHIRWHDVFADKRLWAGMAIVGFIALFTVLVIFGAKTAVCRRCPIMARGRMDQCTCRNVMFSGEQLLQERFEAAYCD